MHLRFSSLLLMVLLLAACQEEYVDFTHEVDVCSVPITPEQCPNRNTKTSDILVDVVALNMKEIYISAEQDYQSYAYNFNEDGTYQLHVAGFAPLGDCIGYSDGNGSYEEEGTFIFDQGSIALIPETFYGFNEYLRKTEAYEISINHLDDVNSSITLSGPNFCRMEFDVVPRN